MAQLWEWTAISPDGSTHGYMTQEPSGCASEAGMLEFLKTNFRNLTVIALRRCGPFEPRKDPVGPVHRSAYQFGLWDAAMIECGRMKPPRKETILQRLNRERVLRLSGRKTILNH